MSEEIKACPFCGSDKLFLDREYVHCTNCLADGPYFTDGKQVGRPVIAWNTRAPDPLLMGALEALRGMIGGKCPDCKGWGEVAYFGEMVRCKCNGNYRHHPGDASREKAAAILTQARERGL